jgi:NTP pyrophosphatase (non-canonical NTP hydrolase)
MAKIKDLVRTGSPELYKRCLGKWGRGSQMTMLIEECSELITIVARLLRGRENVINNLVEEIADVEIMIEQIKYIYNINELVLVEKDRKLERLEKRIGGRRSWKK